MRGSFHRQAAWHERVREPSLTALLACLLFVTFVVTPLVELGVIGQLAAAVIGALPTVLSVLVISGSHTCTGC